jgi:glycyl-tRNA synthetase beta chain
MQGTLLVELLTEELPPKALKELSDVFASKVFVDLQKAGFLADKAAARPLATPRRLAMLVSNVQERSPDSEREVQGPSTSAPPQAVAGFAKKSGVAPDALKKQQTPKGEVYVAQVKTPGKALADVLPEFVASAIKALPVPKMMRWGDGDAQFVRPVHGLVMLHGSQLIDGKVLGLASGKRTMGHRFLGNRAGER